MNSVIPLGVGLALVALGPLAAQTTNCAQYDTIPVDNGQYNIQTDEWNSAEPQCLTITGESFTVSTASFDLPTDGPPASFPSIYKGCHWATCTTNSGLPLQVSNIKTAKSAWSTTPAPGNWDTAYDIWFNQTPTTSGQPDGTELMIWINHQGPPQPAGTEVGSVVIGGATWQVWTGFIGWNIISYVREQPATSVKLNLLPFFSDAVSRGSLQPAWWLISIEAGFEIWDQGQGLASHEFTAVVAGK